MASSRALARAAIALRLLSTISWHGAEALSAAAASGDVGGGGGGVTSSTSSTSSSSSSRPILRSSRDYRLLEVVPHDTSSFTQGLTYFDGHIYEGTGMERQSRIMRHDPDDNMRTTHTTAPLEPSHLFGEGISHYHVWTTTTDGSDDDDDDDDDDDGSSGGGGRERRKRRARRRRKEHRLIQLTWTSKVGRVYSLPELTPLREFEFDTSTGEGWGITFVSHRNEFYVSDGSEYLSVWDADTLAEKRRIVVTFEGGGGGGGGENAKRRIRHLNELEFVDFAVVAPDCDDDDDYSRTATEGGGGNDNDVWWCAETGTTTCSDDDEGSSSPSSFSPTMAILANLWYQDVLVSIDPESGEINRVFDLRDIYPKDMREEDGSDCLNGISVTGRRRKSNDEGLEVWVTGKLWPSMYRIELNVDRNYII